MQAQIRFTASFRDDNPDPVVRLAHRWHETWQAARLAGDFTGTGLTNVSTPEISYGSDLEVTLFPNQVVLVIVNGRVIAEIAERHGSYIALLGPGFEEIETGVEWDEG